MGGLTFDAGINFDGMPVFQSLKNERYLFYLHDGHYLSVDSIS